MEEEGRAPQRVFDEDDDESQPLGETSTRKNILQRIPALFSTPKSRFYLLIGLILTLVLVIAITIAGLYDKRRTGALPYKNIIIMVSDGYGPAGQTLTRYTSLADDNYTVIFDQFLRGTVRTRSFDSLITDSAAGATAYATGFKTNNEAISVDPVSGLPYGTILEAAKLAGMAAGLVVRSSLADATPAAFSSHVFKRSSQTDIAKQQLTKNIEVMLGAGKKFYDTAAYQKAGYKLVQTAAEMNATFTTPIIGLFAEENMNFVIDDVNSTQPTLPQMVSKALSLLESSSTGFFLLIEGSRIDHAAHQNDPAAYYREARQYDETMRYVSEWADSKASGDTLVVSVSDHETGGLALGRWFHGEEYYPVYTYKPSYLLPVTRSTEAQAKMVRKGDDPRDVVLTYSAINITQDQWNTLMAANQTGEREVMLGIGDLISRKARLGWSTIGHTGVDINLYVVYDSLANRLGQPSLEWNMENTDVGKAIAAKCNLDLQATTDAIRLGWNSTDPKSKDDKKKGDKKDDKKKDDKKDKDKGNARYRRAEIEEGGEDDAFLRSLTNSNMFS